MKYFVQMMGAGARTDRLILQGSILAVGAVSDDGRRGVEIDAQESNRQRGGDPTWRVAAVDAGGLMIQPVANNCVHAIPAVSNPINLVEWDQAQTLERALKAERFIHRLLTARSQAERLRLVDALITAGRVE